MRIEMNLSQGPWCGDLMKLLLEYIICRSKGLDGIGDILTRGGGHPAAVGFVMTVSEAGGGYSPEKRYLSQNRRRLHYLCKL